MTIRLTFVPLVIVMKVPVTLLTLVDIGFRRDSLGYIYSLGNTGKTGVELVGLNLLSAHATEDISGS